jgi:CRISPR system Cascade subunit CasA
MNLTTDPWIPIVWDSGQPGLVSLADAFKHGERIHDLAVRPHERIALMRLLICISQASLDGPNDFADWQTCRSALPTATVDYLIRWNSCFELYGSDIRFMQIPELKQDDAGTSEGDDVGALVSKLDLALATGNNATLFDNAGGTQRIFDHALLAVNLLCFLCFSPGGRIGVASWNGQETAGNGSSEHAPCIAGSMLHALLRGDNLMHSIHLNLLTKSQIEALMGKDRWGKPIWELRPKGLDDSTAVQNATATYLGRLTPLSRAVRLNDDYSSMVWANGLKFAPYPEWREPTATVVVRKSKQGPERTLLRGSLEKAPWRELHSLTVRTISRESNGGLLALNNCTDDAAFDLWVGGIVANQGKLLDTVESVFHIPAAMLKEPSQGAYEKGVAYAQNWEFRLCRAITSYHKAMGEDLGRPETRDRRVQIQKKATFQFWTDIERCVKHLLAVAENPTVLDGNSSWHKTEWGRFVCKTACAALAVACPHATARQIKAYALAKIALLSPQTEH